MKSEARNAFGAISFFPLVIAGFFVFANFCISRDQGTKLRQELQYEPDLYGNFTPIYMTGMIINIDNISRISDMIKYWGDDFKMLSPASTFRVATPWELIIFPDAKIVTEVRPRISQPQQYHYMFEDHLRDFLEHTNLRWFIRTTEDSFTHLKRLPKFISDLEAKYNPLNDIVMEGQVVQLAEGIFIHGGAGWVMSRAAARYYFDNRDEIHDKWLKTGQGDDVLPDVIKTKLGWKTERMCNEAFVGSPVVPEAREQMLKSNYSNLPECPSEVHQKSQARPILRLNKTVFWHSSTQMLWTLTDGYRILQEAGDLALGHVFEGVKPCRATGRVESALIDQQWV